jgi:methylenetetrahydrofolate dehydrogenase (NADP+) / methenyltetrahydrofolate cyclohydrolase
MNIIDGRAMAEKIKDDIVMEIAALKGEHPNLAIVLIGEREDSRLYVSLKEKEAVKVGIDTHLYKCPADTPQGDILKMMEFLNNDKAIDAILVQLPFPENLDTDKIIAAINPQKDVDGFHPDNLKKFMSTCDHRQVMPPVAEVILEILKNINFVSPNKKAVVVANSEIFGKTMAKALECRGVIVRMIKKDDGNLKAICLASDLIVTAAGERGLITGEMIKPDVVIIDIGISKIDGRVYGDVDFESVKDIDGQLTPVPGGVGPMTIAMAFKNTLELFKRRRKY